MKPSSWPKFRRVTAVLHRRPWQLKRLQIRLRRPQRRPQRQLQRQLQRRQPRQQQRQLLRQVGTTQNIVASLKILYHSG